MDQNEQYLLRLLAENLRRSRQREILLLMAREKSSAEIAQELILQTKTVRNYISTILSKMQVLTALKPLFGREKPGSGKNIRPLHTTETNVPISIPPPWHV